MSGSSSIGENGDAFKGGWTIGEVGLEVIPDCEMSRSKSECCGWAVVVVDWDQSRMDGECTLCGVSGSGGKCVEPGPMAGECESTTGTGGVAAIGRSG